MKTENGHEWEKTGVRILLTPTGGDQSASLSRGDLIAMLRELGASTDCYYGCLYETPEDRNKAKPSTGRGA